VLNVQSVVLLVKLVLQMLQLVLHVILMQMLLLNPIILKNC